MPIRFLPFGKPKKIEVKKYNIAKLFDIYTWVKNSEKEG